jgi:ketosteroid isomerase-like protein
MSRENVEVVVGTFENTNTRDFEAVMDAFADDVVLALHRDLHGDLPVGAEGAAGKAAVGEWFGEWFRTFERDYRFEVHEARDWGDRVFIDATHHGKGRISGAPVTRRAGWVYRVRDGRIARIDAYPTPESALADAEPPSG